MSHNMFSASVNSFYARSVQPEDQNFRAIGRFCAYSLQLVENHFSRQKPGNQASKRKNDKNHVTQD